MAFHNKVIRLSAKRDVIFVAMSLPLPPPAEYHNLSVQEERFYNGIKNFPAHDVAQIRNAYVCAKEAHAPQMRDDGTPYILHPLRATISLIIEAGVTNPDILSAALLHDVIEDTPVTVATIERDFGATVARLVQNVTRPHPADGSEETIRHDKAVKFMAIMDSDEETRMVKCADVLDNVRSWPNIPCGSAAQKKLQRWHTEVQNYALPLAQKTHPALFKELSNAFAFSKEHSDLCVTVSHHSLSS